MRIRKHKWISGLLILAMLISGICFGECKADPVHACAPAQTADSRIAAADNVSGQTVACISTEDIVSARASHILPAKSISADSFLCRNFFSLRKGVSYTDFDRVRSAGISGEESVATYLHRSDGKKRI